MGHQRRLEDQLVHPDEPTAADAVRTSLEPEAGRARPFKITLLTLG
jgi:hypothetical protein